MLPADPGWADDPGSEYEMAYGVWHGATVIMAEHS